jgi:basic membrane lipoprotein Med (substrate-binding protein (PBP1-ABC) superfamily)
MRMRAALAVLVVCAATGCGAAKHTSSTTTATAQTVTHRATQSTATSPAKPQSLAVAVVGPLEIRVPGATVTHDSLDHVSGGQALVLVSVRTATLVAVHAAAAAHPSMHFAYVGGSTRGAHRPNLAGVVLRDDQAAYLGGVVAALVVRDEGGTARRVAWVGPQERGLTAAFRRGAHVVDPGIEILVAPSTDVPAACKEAALGVTGRGAVVIMAHGGGCADAAIAGSHQANHVGLQLSDFELPDVAATQIVREAVAGVLHGGEDIVFGASSGAIGVARLDPRISPATAVEARAAAQNVASGLPPSG